MAKKLRCKPDTVKKWGQRNRIPTEHWAEIVRITGGLVSVVALLESNRRRAS